MKESYVEAQLRKKILRLGGLCYKFVSPGCAGVPDRVVILPGGRVFWVELKTETGRLAKIQIFRQKEMRARGADVRTLYGLRDVEAFLKEVGPFEVRSP